MPTRVGEHDEPFMKNQIRTFIAVSLPSPLLAGIEKLTRTLQKQLTDVRWVEPQNLHVTFKFLGDIPLNDLPELIQAVTRCVCRMDSFDMTLQGLGAFPDWESPKILWIGCREGAEELRRLAEKINECLFPLGYPQEARRFSPHLTIGRVKKPEQGILMKSILGEHQDRLFGSCSVSEVQVFSSELTRRGPLYSEIAAIPLQSQ